MRPSFSIILFTTLSGAGYGLWFAIGILLALGLYPTGRGGLLVALAVGLVLSSSGLLCSVAHLGKPLRAWRALSQWRSSWLSREGIAALACVPLVLLLAARAHHSHDFPKIRIAGFLLAAMAMLVVFCTARIYTSLRTVDAWHNRRVLPGFLLLAIETGALWFWVLLTFRTTSVTEAEPVDNLPVAWMLVVGAAVISAGWNKRSYWKSIDNAASTSDMQSATGLGKLGTVHSLEQPHTEANYLTHEMGFVLARRHAMRLRTTCLYLLLAIPLLMVGASCLLPFTQPVAASVALVSAMLGVFIERWMFFAEAKHKVMLYYGARSGASAESE